MINLAGDTRLGWADSANERGLLTVTETNADTYYSMTDFTYEHTGTVADVATGRFFAKQSGNNVNMRALELDMLKMTGDVASAAIALDCTIESQVVGNGIDGTVAAWFRNLGTTWGLTGPDRVDTGLLIGRDEHGFTNGILYQSYYGEITPATFTTLFKVDSTGRVSVGASSAALPGVSLVGDPNTGLSWPAADTLAFVTAGTDQIYVTSAGLLSFVNGQGVALGGGAAPTLGTIGGSGPTAAAQSGWLSFLVAGAPRFMPYWT